MTSTTKNTTRVTISRRGTTLVLPHMLLNTDTSTNAGMALMAIDIGVISWSRMLKRLSRNDISTPAMVPNTRP